MLIGPDGIQACKVKDAIQAAQGHFYESHKSAAQNYIKDGHDFPRASAALTLGPPWVSIGFFWSIGWQLNTGLSLSGVLRQLCQCASEQKSV